MKELTIEEVLRIAGGVPPAAALDELTYRTPEIPVAETQAAREVEASMRPPKAD